jgi:hypothetical protein
MLLAAEGYAYQLYIGGEYELDQFPDPSIFETPRPATD